MGQAQNWAVNINTNIPASFSYGVGNVDVAGYLNGILLPAGIGNLPIDTNIKSYTWDTYLTAVLQAPLLAKGCKSAIFTNAKWINKDGKCTLSSVLTTDSDPISAGDIVVIIIGAGLVITGALLVVLGWTGWGVILIIAIGGVAIAGATVDILGSSAGNIAVTAILVVGGLIGGALLLSYLSSRKKRSRGVRRRT
jgi:hypothetical protein